MKTEERKYFMTKTVYVADDGTEFDFERECFEYDAKISNDFRDFSAISYNAENIPEDGFGHYLVAFVLKSSEDVHAMNAWLDRICSWRIRDDEPASPRFTVDDIGIPLVFSVATEYDESVEYDRPCILNFTRMSYEGTAEGMKKSYCDYIDSFTKF